VTRTSAIDPRARARTVVALAALAAAAVLVVPAARAAGTSIVACNGSVAPAACTSSAATIPAANGVYFKVTNGGGNRGFVSVEVTCDNGYGTVLTVLADPKSGGTSQTVYPGAGSCVANLEKQMQIGKAHVLATVSFTVS
jgi:hypothetical protein